MHGLLEDVKLTPKQALALIDKLIERGKVLPNQRDSVLIERLEQLGIVKREGSYWQLCEPQRVESVRNQITQHTLKNKRPGILRKMPVVHHKSAAAWRGHSKSAQCEALQRGQLISTDDVVRIRTQKTGFVISSDNATIDADLETLQRTEVSLPERLYKDAHGPSVAGVRLVLTVENLGAFVDFPMVDGLVVVYSSGNNFASSVSFIKRFLEEVTWVHFPDLDPNGLIISTQMADALNKPCNVWIPPHWDRVRAQPLVSGKGKKVWGDAPACPEIASLQETSHWVEQEVLVLDQRSVKAVSELVSEPKHRLVTLQY